MNEKKQMTKEEVLQVTAETLGGINVPAALSEEIGIPIKRCMENVLIALNMCRAEADANAAQKAIDADLFGEGEAEAEATTEAEDGSDTADR